jgi:hypothetical protein
LGVFQLSKNKCLQILPLSKIDTSQSTYLINEKNQTAILISKNIEKTLRKMSNPSEHKSLIAADIFSVALLNRRLNNVSESLKLWESSAVKMSDYPTDNSTKAFSKFIREILLSPLFEGYFNEKEIKDLVDFFARCPHDYSFSAQLVLAHQELKPVLV